MFLFQLLLTNWTIFTPHIHTRLFSYKWALPTEVVRLLLSFLVSQWRRIVNHAITTVSSTSVRYCAIWSISWVPSAVESFPRRLVPTVFQIELFQGRAPAHNIRMRMRELTSRELSLRQMSYLWCRCRRALSVALRFPVLRTTLRPKALRN